MEGYQDRGLYHLPGKFREFKTSEVQFSIPEKGSILIAQLLSLEGKTSISREQYEPLNFSDSYTGDMNKMELAHLRWCCAEEDTLRMIGGATFKGLKMRPCRVCLRMTAQRAPASKFSRIQPPWKGHTLEYDLSGRLRMACRSGANYIVNIVDVHLGTAHTAGLSKKSDFEEELKFVIKRNDRRKDRTVVVRGDRAGENISDSLRAWGKKKGLTFQSAGPQQHSSIGNVEGYGGKQFTKVRCQMAYGGAPASLADWPCKNYATAQEWEDRHQHLRDSPRNHGPSYPTGYTCTLLRGLGTSQPGQYQP